MNLRGQLTDRAKILLDKYCAILIANPLADRMAAQKIVRMIVDNNNEELLQLLSSPKYYDLICYFAECYGVPDDVQKAIELMDIIGK
jgi:hypothetical protein